MEELPTMQEISDSTLVIFLKDAIAQENGAKELRQEVEAEIEARLLTKEEAGEKATIQLVTGESVSLSDEKLFFKYEEVHHDEMHNWVKSVGLGNLIKEPKIHHASLNSALRELIKDGVDLPTYLNIDSHRTLTKRGMK